MLVKCTRFHPYFDRKDKSIGKKSQSRDKILYILLAFVFYPVVMVASQGRIEGGFLGFQETPFDSKIFLK